MLAFELHYYLKLNYTIHPFNNWLRNYITNIKRLFKYFSLIEEHVADRRRGRRPARDSPRSARRGRRPVLSLGSVPRLLLSCTSVLIATRRASGRLVSSLQNRLQTWSLPTDPLFPRITPPPHPSSTTPTHTSLTRNLWSSQRNALNISDYHRNKTHNKYVDKREIKIWRRKSI